MPSGFDCRRTRLVSRRGRQSIYLMVIVNVYFAGKRRTNGLCLRLPKFVGPRQGRQEPQRPITAETHGLEKPRGSHIDKKITSISTFFDPIWL